MNIPEAMEVIAKEAERQGFQARQIRSGTWQFRKDGQNWFCPARSVEDILDTLSVLAAAGLDWAVWALPWQD